MNRIVGDPLTSIPDFGNRLMDCSRIVDDDHQQNRSD
jgi:hypothetical protein